MKISLTSERGLKFSEHSVPPFYDKVIPASGKVFLVVIVSSNLLVYIPACRFALLLSLAIIKSIPRTTCANTRGERLTVAIMLPGHQDADD